MRFPLHCAVNLETSYIPLGDRFAAQIVYATGRCPPMYRLPSTDLFLSFQFFGLRLVCHDADETGLKIISVG